MPELTAEDYAAVRRAQRLMMASPDARLQTWLSARHRTELAAEREKAVAEWRELALVNVYQDVTARFPELDHGEALAFARGIANHQKG